MTDCKGSDEPLRVLACQISIPPMRSAHERDEHLRDSSARVRDALNANRDAVDLVVLPELSSIDYSRATFENLNDLAEPLNGPSFSTWAQIAVEFEVFVVFGFARRDGTSFRISTAVVAPDGSLVGSYDKLHLAQFGASMEKEYFSAGSQLFVFEVKGVRCAPIICYDIRIPELSRQLVIDQDVDLILHCGAYFRDDSFDTWHTFVTTRALENQCHILSLNRAGHSYGNSLICGPWHDQKTPPLTLHADAEELRVFSVSKSERERAKAEYSFLADRLPDYGALEVTGSDRKQRQI